MKIITSVEARYEKRNSTLISSWGGQSRAAMAGFHDNSSTDISSTTLRPQTFRLQTFRLLLYTSVQDSYTSNFSFSKSFLSIPTSTYTMIPFHQSHFH